MLNAVKKLPNAVTVTYSLLKKLNTLVSRAYLCTLFEDKLWRPLICLQILNIISK